MGINFSRGIFYRVLLRVFRSAKRNHYLNKSVVSMGSTGFTLMKGEKRV